MRVKPAIVGATIPRQIHESAPSLVASIDDVPYARRNGRTPFAFLGRKFCLHRVFLRTCLRDILRRDVLRAFERPLGLTHGLMAIEKLLEHEFKSFIKFDVALLSARQHRACFFQKLKHLGRNL